jgi:hypothetical protein
MLKRLSFAAAAATLATACATTTTPAGTSGAATAGAVALTPAAAATTLNIAASTSWLAEDGLIPDQPKLVLITQGGTVDNSAGFALSCNPDNGMITGRLSKQAATRAGQEAVYKMKTGKSTISLDGQFMTKGANTDFVFPLETKNLREIATSNVVTVTTDQGDTQWGFVVDPNTAVPAKYVASLKNFGAEMDSFIVYCNPK